MRRRHRDNPPCAVLNMDDKSRGEHQFTIYPHRFSGTRIEGIFRLATIKTWKPRRMNDIIPAEPWSRWCVRKDTPRRSARKLRWRPAKTGIRLISERFAAR